MEKQLALPNIGRLLFNPSIMNDYRELHLGLYEHRPRKFGEFITQNDFEWSTKTLYPKALRGTGIEFGMTSSLETPLENFVCQGSEHYHGIERKPYFDVKEVYIELLPKEKLTWKEIVFGFRYDENFEKTLKVKHHLCSGLDGALSELDDKVEYEIHRRSKRSKDPEYWEDEKKRFEEHNKKFRMALGLPVNEPSIHDIDPFPSESWGHADGLDLGETSMRAFFAQNLPKFRFARSWLSKRLPEVLYAEEKSAFAGVVAKAAEIYSLGAGSVSAAIGSVENQTDFGTV